MDRPGRQRSFYRKFDRPPLPWVVLTDLQAVDIAMGSDGGTVEYIEKECCRGDWAMDSIQSFMQFSFADERDAIIFKLKFA